MLVVDSSALVTSLIEQGPRGVRARERIEQSADIHTPQIIELEVISVLRRKVRLGTLSSQRAKGAIEDLAVMARASYSTTAFRHRIWELRDNLSPYDASYVALAESLGCTLLTADRRLSQAPGATCEIELLA